MENVSGLLVSFLYTQLDFAYSGQCKDSAAFTSTEISMFNVRRTCCFNGSYLIQ